MIRIYNICCLLFILFAGKNYCYSQNNATDINYQKLGTRLIGLNTLSPKLKIPVDSIEVHDFRHDTTTIGFLKTSDNKHVQLRFSENLEKTISAFCSPFAQPDTGLSDRKTLHCYIKKLQLTDAIILDDRRVDGMSRIQSKETSGIIFKAEFYCQQNDTFVPLYRFDTTLYGDATIWTAGPAYIEKAIVAGFSRAETLNLEQALKNRTRLSPGEISNYNEKQFSIPALRETPIIGIYPSFEAFLQNKPLQIPFSVSHKNGENVIYLKDQQGKDSAYQKAWGYCDSTGRYIFSDFNFYKLQRRENGFLLYGVNRIKRGNATLLTPYPGTFGGTDILRVRFRNNIKNWRIFQLDMDNGNFY